MKIYIVYIFWVIIIVYEWWVIIFLVLECLFERDVFSKRGIFLLVVWFME